jgi:protein CpxP
MRHLCAFLFAGVLLIGIGVTGAAAQDNSAQGFGRGGHHRPMDVDSELSHLTRELNLTPDQQKQIRPLLLEHQQKEQVLHQDQSLSPEDLRTRAHAISDETHKKIEVFLTDEQKQKVKAMQQRMHHSDQNGQPSAPSSPSPTSTPFAFDPAADVTR